VKLGFRRRTGRGIDDPAPEPPKGLREQWQLMRRVSAFLKPIKLQAAVVIFVFIIGIGFEVLTVRLIGPAVDVVEEMSVKEKKAQAKASAKRGARVGVKAGTGKAEVFADATTSQGPAEENEKRDVADGTTPESKASGKDLTLWAWLTAAEGTGARLRRALLFLALAKLGHSIFIWLRIVMVSWQNMSMVYYMRAAVYDRLQRVGFAFHDQHASGALINRALSDLQAVRHFVQETLHVGVDLTFSTFAYFAIFVTTSPQLACVALVALPLWVWAIRRFAIKARPIWERQMYASDDVVNVLTENAAGVHVVRAFATEELEKDKFGKATTTLVGRIFDGIGLRQRMLPAIRGIAVGTNVVIWALGAILVQRGEMGLGDLVVFGAAMGIILGKMHMINMMAEAYQQALVSSGRLFEILDSPDSTPEAEGAEPLPPGGGAVRFDKVTFGYDAERAVVEDVSFDVPAGSVVALVGPTGSGKSTVMALLGRCYDTTSGTVSIDGANVRACTIQSVRDQVGYVFQETYLFSNTIARNIAYADLNARRYLIEQAARIAHADEFIQELPEGYDTYIGEYGATLSGGQRQRIAIARAILHNPRVLVLDDSLSAVDPETEAQIRKDLEKIMKHRTTFIITSRISTAQRADRVLVMEKGRLTQQGTHDKLIRQRGYYRDMAESQFAEPSRMHEASHLDRMRKRRKATVLAEQESETDEEENGS
jgi:ATP-binding cassette subfamily B protein